MMAKNYGFAAAVIAALCLVGVAHCVESLTVEGPVYCDTCRVDFATPLSYDLKGRESYAAGTFSSLLVMELVNMGLFFLCSQVPR